MTLNESKCKCKVREFAPEVIGMTVGGLWLRGWDRCQKCGLCYLSKKGEPCPSPTWLLSRGGQSVEIGIGRIRFGRVKLETSERIDVQSLMSRIARLPDLEREVEALRKQLEKLNDEREQVAAVSEVPGACCAPDPKR